MPWRGPETPGESHPLVEEGYLDREAYEQGYYALTDAGLEALARCEGPFAIYTTGERFQVTFHEVGEETDG